MPPKVHLTTAGTFLEFLIQSIGRESDFNQNDEIRPTVVLWTDKDREWAGLLPLLRKQLPHFLTYGPFDPSERQGPAIWLKCALAGTIPGLSWPASEIPILYLPGVSRAELRAIEETAKELQPLAELQFRGNFWSQLNGKDWTLRAFLTSANGGLQLDMAGDQATLEACRSALAELADTLVDKLRGRRLEATDFHGLLTQDPVKDLLVWMDAPTATEAQWSDARTQAFLQLCRGQFQFDPKKDGPLVAAERMADRTDAWAQVWERFCESPRRYGKIPDLIRQATANKRVDMFYDLSTWPQHNAAKEDQLRAALAALEGLPRKEVMTRIQQLEAEHGPRCAWVWAALGQSPLAQALVFLAQLAEGQSHPLKGNTLEALAEAFAQGAWRVDDAALQALSAPMPPEDEKAIQAAVKALYREWLEESAGALQDLVAKAGYPDDKTIPLETRNLAAGECAVFADGLRMDLGQRLRDALQAEGLKVELGWTWVAFPSVTATSKPAVSPIADLLTGTSDGKDFIPSLAEGNKALTTDRFQKELGVRGLQFLKGEVLGEPAQPGWTESGDIDHYGHEHGWRLARHAQEQVRALQQRIQALLDHGWTRVKVVTDHGWLLLPGGLPKRELPASLTETRWSRCAMLKNGCQTDLPRVPWFWNAGLEVASAPGAGVFKAGTEYAHGGLSPQECIVPVLIVTAAAAPAGTGKIVSAEWNRLRCRVKVEGAPAGCHVDLREKVADPGSSLADKVAPLKDDGTAALFARDDGHEGKAAFVVLLGPGAQVSGKAQTVVGGDQ